MTSEVETSKKELVNMETSLQKEKDKVSTLKDEFEAAKKEAKLATESHSKKTECASMLHLIVDEIEWEMSVMFYHFFSIFRNWCFSKNCS